MSKVITVDFGCVETRVASELEMLFTSISLKLARARTANTRLRKSEETVIISGALTIATDELNRLRLLVEGKPLP